MGSISALCALLVGIVRMTGKATDLAVSSARLAVPDSASAQPDTVLRRDLLLLPVLMCYHTVKPRQGRVVFACRPVNPDQMRCAANLEGSLRGRKGRTTRRTYGHLRILRGKL